MPDFELIQRAEQPTAVVHERVPMKDLPQFFQRAFGEVFRAMQAQGIAPVGAPFALYFGMPTDTVEVEAGFPVQRPLADAGAVHPGKLPPGKCAHATHVGPYDTMTRTYDALMHWVQAQHLVPHDEMWEVYLSDPQREPDPKTWRTEIFWPVD